MLFWLSEKKQPQSFIKFPFKTDFVLICLDIGCFSQKAVSEKAKSQLGIFKDKCYSGITWIFTFKY